MVNDEKKLGNIRKLLKSDALKEYTKLDNILKLLKSDALKEYAEKRKEFDLDKKYKFNIFETISDTYYKENFHTDILFSILDPNTPEIGPIRNEEILKEFVETVANDKSFEFTIDGTVNVSKQVYNFVNGKEGYIDLLITNDYNQAIIIENKINDAPDMEDQLARYMEHVDKEIFKNTPGEMRVVYLTLIPNEKKPNIDEYDDYFSDYKDLLNDGETLKYRYAVDKGNSKHDLIYFLYRSISLLEAYSKNISNTEEKQNSLLKKIYLEQYRSLLLHLGGEAKMSDFTENLLEKIYEDQDLLDAANELYEIFSDWRKKPQRNYDRTPTEVSNFFDKKLKDICYGTSLRKDPNDKGFITEKGNYIFYVCGAGLELEIGFVNRNENKKIEATKRKKFKGILEKTLKTKLEGDECNTEFYVYHRIYPLEGQTSMEDFLGPYKTKIQTIEKLFLKA